jgi:hypothetical protein
LADWDGDGACDIIWTDPDDNNTVALWRNRIKETGDFNWDYQENPAPDLYCNERRGLGFFDRPVHLADVSGKSENLSRNWQALMIGILKEMGNRISFASRKTVERGDGYMIMIVPGNISTNSSTRSKKTELIYTGWMSMAMVELI